MVEFGPIQLMVIGFPSLDKLKGELLRETFRLSEAGIIRVVGIEAIVKHANGEIKRAHFTELPAEERIKLGAGVGALLGLGAAGEEGAKVGAEVGAQAVAQRVAQREFGLSEAQIKEIAEDMPSDTAAAFVLIEHLWAKKLKEIARAQDGVLLANGLISPEALVTIGRLLEEGAEAAERVELR